MDFVINFTEMRDTTGNISKKLHIEPDGKAVKGSKAEISNGTAKTLALTPLQFIDYLNDLSNRSDTCIVPGVWVDGYQNYAEYDITTDKKGDADPSIGLITRSTKFFKYLNSDSISFMVFDIDEDYAIDEIHEFIRKLEIALSDAIMGSAQGLMRFEKPSSSAGVVGNGIEINGKVYNNEKLGNGFHIYIPVKNMTEGLLSDIFKWAWLNGYQKYKISKAGTILSRSIVDESVKNPERVTFESDYVITGETKLVELVERKCDYFPGGVLDCELARSSLYDEVSGFNKQWNEYKQQLLRTPEIKEEVQRISDLHKVKLITNKQYPAAKATKVTNLLFEDHVILSDEFLTKSDGTLISVYDILTDRDSYLGHTHFQDFISPEPGTNKAMIIGSGIDNPVRLKSFAHGEMFYYLKFTYEDLMKWIGEAEPEDIMLCLTSFIAQSDLTPMQEDMAVNAGKRANKAISMKAIRDELKIKKRSTSETVSIDSREIDLEDDFSSIDKDATQSQIASDMLAALGPCRVFGGKLYIADKKIWKTMRVEALEERVSNRYVHCTYCKVDGHYGGITDVFMKKSSIYCEEWDTPPGIPCSSQFLMVGENITGDMSGVPVDGLRWVDYDLKLGCRFKLKFNPDWSCDTPYWNKILNNITNVGCFQQAFGLALSGYLTAKMQKAAVFYGEGGTGKGTINSILMAMLPKGRTTNLDFTQMRDKNMCVPLAESVINFMTETDKSDKPYDLSGFKKATGGDHMQGWILYKGVTKFKPTASQVLNFNDWPRLTSAGSDIRRRLGHFIIEFKKNYDEEIVGLVDKIIEHELPGVLAWGIDGIISYFRDGIDDEYSLELYQRWVGTFSAVDIFLDQCTVMTARHENAVKKPGLWRVYSKWCGENGFSAGSSGKFYGEMTKRFGGVDRSHGSDWFEGLKMNSEGIRIGSLIGVKNISRGRKKAGGERLSVRTKVVKTSDNG